MTTAQLEAEAAGRTPPVDLSGAANNADRRNYLRDADAVAKQAAEFVIEDEDVEASEPETAPTDAPPEELENQSSSDYSTASQDALDERIAATPYVSEQDRQNRIDNAGGGEVR